MQNLRARAYSPTTGRFIGLDPFAGNMQDPQSLHKYAYVHGDPIQGVDPTGEYLGGAISVAVIGAVFGVLGNGLANISNNRSFFENAGSAALWGAGLATFSVLVPAAGVLLAGVGIGLAINNFASVWNSDPPPTPGQLWAASALVLLSAVGAFGAAKYGGHTSSKGLFSYNPGGFNYSVAAAFRTNLEQIMNLGKALKDIKIFSKQTTAVGLVQKANGEIVKVVMGNGRNGRIAKQHRDALPADVETPTFNKADVPAKFLNSSGRPHAEGYIFAWAESIGAKVLGVGANRGICGQCAKMATDNGAGHLTPLSDRNYPGLSTLELFYDWFGFTGFDAINGAVGGASGAGLIDGEDYDSQAY